MSDIREAVILASLVATPTCLEPCLVELEQMICTNREHSRLQGFLLSYCGEPDALVEATEAGFGSEFVATLLNRPHVKIAPSVRNAGDVDFVTECLKQEFALHSLTFSGEDELEDLIGDIDAATADEGLTWRVAQYAKSRETVGKGPEDTEIDFETAKNGAKVNTNERAALENLLEQINFKKSSKR